MLKTRIKTLEKKIVPTNNEPLYLRFVGAGTDEDGTDDFGFAWFISGGEWHTSEEGESEQDFIERVNAQDHAILDGDKAVQELMEKDDC